MALSAYQSTSPTVSTQEYSLAGASTGLQTLTDRGVYSLAIDVNALSTNETFLSQVYESATSGGTKRVAKSWTLTSTFDDVTLLPENGGGLLLGRGWDWTINRTTTTAGASVPSNRALPYTLWRIS